MAQSFLSASQNKKPATVIASVQGGYAWPVVLVHIEDVDRTPIVTHSPCASLLAGARISTRYPTTSCIGQEVL